MNDWIVVTGNPVDGLLFTGPFGDADAAINWAEVNAQDAWWVSEIEEPKE